MTKTPQSRRYLRFFGNNFDADVEEELNFHLDAKIDELVAQGLTRENAQAEAKMQFGDLGTVRRNCERLRREDEQRVHRAEYFVGWRQDLRYGLRQLCQKWPTTLLAIFTLGIGIGAVAAVFSIVHAVVLRPLPFPNPEEIVTLWSTRQGHDDEVTPRNFDSWRRNARSFKEVAALERTTFSLSETGSATQVLGGAVTSDFFSVFGVSPLFGRTFRTEEDQPPRQHLVVLSYRLWQEKFATDRAVLGRRIYLDREPYTVIGVMPAYFDLRPEGEQLWTPLALSGQEMNWGGGVLSVFGRLQPHLTIGMAQAEMAIMSRVLQVRYPDMNRGRDIRVGEFAADLVGSYRQQLLILLSAVGSVLLIACANVANLLLARGAGRNRELTIRAALGATRSRIIRQLLIECLLLSIAGAVVGIAISGVSIRMAKLLESSAVPRLRDASIDATVLIVVLGLAVTCTMVFGILPALRASRLNLQGIFGQSGRSAASLAHDRLKNAYIAAEVGLALVLLVAAGLLIRTAIAAQNVEPGFVPDRLVAGRTSLPLTAYKTADEIEGAYERILNGLASQHGVVSAALTSKVPLGSSGLGLVLKPNSVISPLKDDLATELRYVSPGYFSTMQIPLVQGREFSTHDRTGSPQVVLVNETLARRLWPGQEAVGKTLRLPDLDTANAIWAVNGVVADVHDNGLMSPAPEVLYLPYTQVPMSAWNWTEESLYIVARTRTSALANTELLRSAIQRVDADLPLGDVRTMDQRLSQSISAARLYTLLLSTLGLCGLVLTAAGIYGVVAYFVTRQRAEIGIRIALGATRGNVLWLVVVQGMRPVVAGVGSGFLFSLLVSRALAAQLYGVGPMDPLTFGGITVLLLAIAVLACYIPAFQASRVDPMIALRGE